MTPVLPSEFQALLPTTQDTICAAFTKSIRFYIKFYKWYTFAYDGAGNLNNGFASDICQALDGCS